MKFSSIRDKLVQTVKHRSFIENCSDKNRSNNFDDKEKSHLLYRKFNVISSFNINIQGIFCGNFVSSLNLNSNSKRTNERFKKIKISTLAISPADETVTYIHTHTHTPLPTAVVPTWVISYNVRVVIYYHASSRLRQRDQNPRIEKVQSKDGKKFFFARNKVPVSDGPSVPTYRL